MHFPGADGVHTGLYGPHRHTCHLQAHQTIHTQGPANTDQLSGSHSRPGTHARKFHTLKPRPRHTPSHGNRSHSPALTPTLLHLLSKQSRTRSVPTGPIGPALECEGSRGIGVSPLTWRARGERGADRQTAAEAGREWPPGLQPGGQGPPRAPAHPPPGGYRTFSNSALPAKPPANAA